MGYVNKKNNFSSTYFLDMITVFSWIKNVYFLCCVSYIYQLNLKIGWSEQYILIEYVKNSSNNICIYQSDFKGFF